MPNQNKSHITIVLDRSGSMEQIRSDVIGAINKFIDDQRAVPGECTFTLTQFDKHENLPPTETIQDFVDIKDAKHLDSSTYKPRGWTPLYDAIGICITDLGMKLEKMAEKDRPGKIIVVIETDGLENSSREYSQSKISEMIEHQKSKYNWQFVFLGANQDAIATGKGLGVAQQDALSMANTGSSYQYANKVTSSKVADYRVGASGQSLRAYTEEERNEAMSQ